VLSFPKFRVGSEIFVVADANAEVVGTDVATLQVNLIEVKNNNID